MVLFKNCMLFIRKTIFWGGGIKGNFPHFFPWRREQFLLLEVFYLIKILYEKIIVLLMIFIQSIYLKMNIYIYKVWLKKKDCFSEFFAFYFSQNIKRIVRNYLQNDRTCISFFSANFFFLSDCI